MIKPQTYTSVIGALLFASLSLQTTAESDSSWDRTVAFYLWVADTEVDATQDGQSVGGGTIKFKDLIDKTEFGYAILAEAGPAEGRWSVFADLAYFELADDPELNGIDIDIDVEATIVDLAGAYSPYLQWQDFGVYVGVRHLAIDTAIGIRAPEMGSEKLEIEDNFTDLLIGARFRNVFSDNWSLKFRADASTGDTEYTFQAECLLGYRLGKKANKQILFGYRYRKTEIEDSGLTQEIETSGPIAAFRLDF